MTDLQTLALCFPVVMVALVIATVTIEELFAQAEMRRESASTRQPAPAGYTGSMTIDVGPGEFKKLLNEIEDSVKRRAS
jgi:hypothetical protein